jgi:hypothetical protein
MDMSRKVTFPILAAVVVIAAAVVVVISLSSRDTGNMASRFGVATARAAESIGHIGAGRAAEAVEKAGKSGKYVFALFYRENDDQTTHARSLVESARKKIARKSEAVEINVADSTERDIVQKFGTSRAPMPLVLVLAPNGAIMGGFPTMQLTDETKLVGAVGSKASEQTVKALQQKNMVVLCAQNRRTADNAGAMRGVEDFLKDPKYGQLTAVVKVDPSDPAEAKFMSQLGIDPASSAATTVLLAPPGSVIGTFQGATPKDKLVAAVQAAAAPRSGGCCPSGSGKSCGPTGGAAAAPQRAPMTVQPQSAQTKMQITKIPPPAAAAPATKSSDPATKNQGK